MKKLKKVLLLFVCAGLLFSVAGCNKKTSQASSPGINLQPLVDDGSGAILPLGDAKGPNGESPATVQDLLNLISPEKKEMLMKGKYRAAVSLHTTAADWSILQRQGIEAALSEFNIELITVTDAQMKVEKQISDLENIISMKPDILISFVLDKDSMGPVLKKASAAGIKVALIDAVPDGFKSPEDYAGMGTADNYANGKGAAQALVDYLGGEGEVAMLNFVSSLFHTDARTKGARDVFAQYPNIKVVAEQGVDGAETGATATESILIANPNLKGIWAVWDTPGMGAVGVIENLGRDVKVVTVDLSEDTAYSIATGGAMLATGAQHPYDQGVAEAMIGIAALAGVKTPSFVQVPGELVTKGTLKKNWERIYKTPLPDELLKLIQ
jgi:ribose transport system substrate-binding protein